MNAFFSFLVNQINTVRYLLDHVLGSRNDDDVTGVNDVTDASVDILHKEDISEEEIHAAIGKSSEFRGQFLSKRSLLWV
jgi:hypothetical protein